MRFLVTGDWGRKGSVEQRSIARAMRSIVRAFPCDFIATTGDNFYDDGVANLDDPHWRESFEDIYDAPELQIPWLVTLGNHDHHGNVDAQVAYSARSARWTLEGNYSSRFVEGAGGAARLVFLDTTPMLARYRRGGVEELPGVEEIDPRLQLDWLEQRLAEDPPCDDAWTFVFGHHPIHSGSSFHGSSRELGGRLASILTDNEVDAYICGHEHDLQHLVSDGIQHFVSGGGGSVPRECGQIDRSLFAASSLGVLLVEVERDSARWCFFDEDATPLYSAASTRRVRAPRVVAAN